MTDKEKQLFSMIREDKNPQEALIIATKVICDFVKQLESFQGQHPASLQEFS